MRNCHLSLVVAGAACLGAASSAPARLAGCGAQKLVVADAAEYANFGFPISTDGQVAIIGSTQAETTARHAGAAYVFRWDAGSWMQEAKLIADDPEPNHGFGNAVGILGDMAFAGAPADDDRGNSSGAVYVFRRDALSSSWVNVQKLAPPWLEAEDAFGSGIAVVPSTLFVAAPRDNDKGVWAGCVHAFGWDGRQWTLAQTLYASDGHAGQIFGASVAAAVDLLIVGTVSDNQQGYAAGAAYVFRFDGRAWMEEQKLLPHDGQATDQFGSSVDIAAETAVVGADRDDDEGMDAGAAYVFEHGMEGWTERAKLTASDGSTNDLFGTSVTCSDSIVVVGSPTDSTSAGYDAGSVYRFVRQDSRWGGGAEAHST